MSAKKRATGRKSPTAKRSPRKAPKPSTSRKASRKPAKPAAAQGQEAAKARYAKSGKVQDLLPDSSKDAVDRAIAGDPEYLYALEARGRPGHYLTDANAHPNEKQVTTTIARAMTWHNRTGPHTHLKRRPELVADFMPIRLSIATAPSANSAAGTTRKSAQAAAQVAARAQATADAPDKTATAAA
jgi:hypothetical protein